MKFRSSFRANCPAPDLCSLTFIAEAMQGNQEQAFMVKEIELSVLVT